MAWPYPSVGRATARLPREARARLGPLQPPIGTEHGWVCEPPSARTTVVVSVAGELIVAHHVGGCWDRSAQRPVAGSWVESVVMVVLAGSHDDRYRKWMSHDVGRRSGDARLSMRVGWHRSRFLSTGPGATSSRVGHAPPIRYP